MSYINNPEIMAQPQNILRVFRNGIFRLQNGCLLTPCQGLAKLESFREKYPMDAGTPRSRWRWLWFTWDLCVFFFWKPAGPAAGHLDDLMIFLEPQQKLTKQKVALQRKLHVHFGQPLDESLHLIQDKAFDYICATGFERQSEVGGNAFVIHLTEWTCDMRRDWKSSCRYFKTLIPGTTWPRPRSSSSSSLTNISYHFWIFASFEETDYSRQPGAWPASLKWCKLVWLVWLGKPSKLRWDMANGSIHGSPAWSDSLWLWLVSRKDRQEVPAVLHRYKKYEHATLSDALHEGAGAGMVAGWAELVSCVIAKDHCIPNSSCEDCVSRSH